MKYLLNIILLFLFGLIIACSSVLEDKGGVLTKIHEFDEYSSTEFVVNVTDVLFRSGKVLFVDEGISKIVMMDQDFKSPEFIGNRGYGPEELMSPTLLLTDKENLFIYDEDKMKILNVDILNGIVFNEMTLGAPLLTNTPVVDESTLYYTTPTEPVVQIQKFDLLKGIKLEGMKLPDNAVKSFFGRHVFTEENGFITVTGYNTPVIEKYSKEWNLIDTYSLEEIPVIKERMDYDAPSKIRRKGTGTAKQTATARITVTCARLHGDTLYLLVYTLGTDLVSRSNTILKFKSVDSSWQPSGKLFLPEMGNYLTFAIQEDMGQLIAFERTSRAVQVFKIDE
ncbi:MAG: hypothetical protein WBB27_04035 [Maribacter sp.]